MYVPDTKLLRGLPLHLAEGYGKPHVGARYVREDVNAYKRSEDANCAVCGIAANEVHHFPPKSKGRSFTLATEYGQFVLLPSLFAVCGFGNSDGCHGGLHSHDLSIEWVWESDAAAGAWWSGWILAHGFTPHDPRLYEYGFWRITDREGNVVREVRHG